jgi:hypothetical protein
MKPETAENWIDYFLNQENNTPIDMPQGDMTQWQNWWEVLKTGNPQRPPQTTMSSIKSEAPIEIPVYNFPSSIPMEEGITTEELTPKIKKKFEIKKKKEPASSVMWF